MTYILTYAILGGFRLKRLRPRIRFGVFSAIYYLFNKSIMWTKYTQVNKLNNKQAQPFLMVSINVEPLGLLLTPAV